MSNPPIPPALSEEEWKNRRAYATEDVCDGQRVHIHANDPAGIVIGSYGSHGVIDDPRLRHALAALCLYDQTFGFTQDDIHDLDICLLGREPLPGTHLHRVKLLRDKILAILPPHHP